VSGQKPFPVSVRSTRRHGGHSSKQLQSL
jgi:hypothetical protein